MLTVRQQRPHVKGLELSNTGAAAGLVYGDCYSWAAAQGTYASTLSDASATLVCIYSSFYVRPFGASFNSYAVTITFLCVCILILNTTKLK